MSSTSENAEAGSRTDLKAKTDEQFVISSPPSKRKKVIGGTVDPPPLLEKQSNRVSSGSGLAINRASSGNEQVSQQQGKEASGGEMETNGSVLNGNTADGSNAGELDTNLYSRQIYALGEGAMRYLRKAAVLVSGQGGIGCEIAKNLILGGVRHVTVQGTKTTTWFDLSAQYYLTERDIGKSRTAACYEKLAELNDSVSVSCITTPIDEQMVKKHQLVILTDSSLKEQLQVNDWCRANGVRFMAADTRGLFGVIFNDFGDSFRVDDADGEQCNEVLIEHVDQTSGDVTTLEYAGHGLQDGDYVTFAEVQGMTELNGCKPLPVTTKTASKFNIGSASVANMSPYKEGGRMKQVKVSKEVHFMSLRDSIAKPSIVDSDFAKFGRPQQLHALFLALHKFVDTKRRLPRPRNEEDADTLISLLPTEGEDGGGVSVDEQLARRFSYQAVGNLCPMISFMGGVAAQEAMKAITHHMTPLNQYLYFDSLESLPGPWSGSSLDEKTLTELDCKPRQCRYDGQAAVFGWGYQEALMKTRWFVVGAGAIGCELLKNFAMMGVGCHRDGAVVVTDMDQIEVSNLNRQFLFRMHDVGSRKSDAAAAAVKRFNQDLNIEALAERVGGDTEHIFSDEFFGRLTGVANALDNIEARQYMDRRCVYYGLPLFESGTMGAKGNTQVVYPFLTESYSSSVDPPEKSFPICTLKHFPTEIQHTIQFARDMFEGLFTNPAETSNQYLKDPRGFLERVDKMATGQKLEVLQLVKKALIDDRPSSPSACVDWARRLFQDQFHDQIAQLLHTFPSDSLTSSGARFWSGAKRCPAPLTFDENNEEHLDFVYSASILRAQQYRLKPVVDREEVKRLAAALHVPVFVPKSGVRIATTDAELQEQATPLSDGGTGDEIDDQIQDLHLSLAKKGTIGGPLVPVDFEKDDDSNHHMEFITACSNLRADNYRIEKADAMKTKQVAGRIIPAIATTTAAISGLVALELYKVVGSSSDSLPKVPIEQFKNGFVNLALPFFAFSEPISAPIKKYNNKEFSLWDSITCEKDLTLQEFLDWCKKEHGLEVSMLSSGVSLIYSFFMTAEKRKTRMGMKIAQAIESVTGQPIPKHVNSLVLEIMASDESDEDVETPYIKYLLSK